MAENNLVILCTCPDEKTANTLSDTLLADKHCACVNILPGVMSKFVWQGEISEEKEVLLIIKTTEQAYKGLEKAIISLHPYEVPEVIALPISAGSNAYLQWMADCVKN